MRLSLGQKTFAFVLTQKLPHKLAKHHALIPPSQQQPNKRNEIQQLKNSQPCVFWERLQGLPDVEVIHHLLTSTIPSLPPSPSLPPFPHLHHKSHSTSEHEQSSQQLDPSLLLWSLALQKSDMIHHNRAAETCALILQQCDWSCKKKKKHNPEKKEKSSFFLVFFAWTKNRDE